VKQGRLQITFDCHDPTSLGRFWPAALGYPEPDVDAWHAHLRQAGRAERDLHDVFAIEDPEGNRPRLFFQRVPEPKTAKNRVHIDIADLVLDQLTSGGAHAHFGFDLSGLSLRATDLDWSFGSGSPVSGTAGDLALLVCGRSLPSGRVQGAFSTDATT